MKKLLSLILLLFIAIILACMFGCRVKKDVAAYSETEIKQSESNEAATSTITNKVTHINQAQTGTEEVKEVTTKFVTERDASDNPVAIPSETTERTTTRKGESATQSQVNEQSKTDNKTKDEESFSVNDQDKYDAQSSTKVTIFKWWWGVIAGAVIGVFLWFRFKPPAFVQKIIEKIKG